MKPREEPEQLLEISKRCRSIYGVVGSEQIVIGIILCGMMSWFHETILALHDEEVH